MHISTSKRPEAERRVNWELLCIELRVLVQSADSFIMLVVQGLGLIGHEEILYTPRHCSIRDACNPVQHVVRWPGKKLVLMSPLTVSSSKPTNQMKKALEKSQFPC